MARLSIKTHRHASGRIESLYIITINFRYRKKDAKLFDEKDGAGPKLEAHCDPKRGWIVMSGDKEVNSIGKVICY